MARPKGSKNKNTEDLAVKLEIAKEHIEEPEPTEPKPRVFLGYHPITGEEVYL